MKTVRRPPYPKWNPGYFPCSSLTPLPLSSRRPSVSFGGFGLIRRGEVVFLIDTTAGKLRLIPAETHDVEGGPFPEEWEYRLTLGGPSKTVTHDFVPAASVLHFRYAVDASTPWRGNGPIAVANLAGRLSAETVNALANESSGPVGRLLGIPVDGEDATVQALKADIRDARGRVALLEAGDWGNAGGDAKVDLKTERLELSRRRHWWSWCQ